ncbi:triacylglycerol lipase 2-like [Euphorbia lathyris]|uniref:triacylglycerol lipase 2-like n=1 Tax=Euphorbia lathyris TaxID=212925 RepID=UPI003313A906
MAVFIVIVLLLLCSSATLTLAATSNLNSISTSNDSICESMAISQGYVCHEFKVTTEDGYILSLQRMPVGRTGKPADKGPVLLQHGLMSDGATWLLNAPDESLAFILADNGYDVWIANTRGTTYSRGHTSLSPTDSAFWEWSWDELAAYDLPAIFQYVHNQTGHKLHYVAHSLGTLMALGAFSQHKLLNLLRSAALLSPIAHLNQIPSPLTKLAADLFLAEELYWLGLREFIPGAQAASKLVENICDKPGLTCSNLIDAFTGPNCCVNSSKTNSFLDNQPQSTSTKNLIHLAQMIRTGKIAMFDYGNEDENMDHYRQPTPPVYNITNIPNDVPLFMGYGGQDTLADVTDVNLLLDSLKHHHPDKLVLLFRQDYAHADFVFGVNANQLVYHPLMAFFTLT